MTPHLQKKSCREWDVCHTGRVWANGLTAALTLNDYSVLDSCCVLFLKISLSKETKLLGFLVFMGT